jgi:sugar phosphate isomerase/epimerase
MASLEIGVVVGLAEPEAELRKATDLGLRSCQVCSWEAEVWTEEIGRRLTAAAADGGVHVTAVWAGWGGPKVWNFLEGPSTIGLVPPAYRAQRVEALKAAASFAAQFHLPAIVTHVGFLPEDPGDPNFRGAVEAVRDVARHCEGLGVEFWFETGQETPVTLLRAIEQVGTDNLGINLDPANLILYGKANPVDALDVFGRYVRGVHAKDGLYPTDGSTLGREVPLGEGRVDFPALVSRLKSLGYGGALTIEREISGPQQIADIRKAIEYLRPLC